MISDTLERLGTYVCLGGGIGKALDFLVSSDLHALPEGKIPLCGDDVFLLVQRRRTCPPEEEPFRSEERRRSEEHTSELQSP